MKYITFVVSIGLAFVVAVFAVQNSAVVSVSMLSWSMEASLVLVILGAAALGFFCAFFFDLYFQIKLRYRLRRSRSRIRELEKELTACKGAEAAQSAAPNSDTVQERHMPE